MPNIRHVSLLAALAGTLLPVGSALSVEPADTAVVPAIPYAARPLPLDAVRLTGGPLKRAQDLDAEYLLKLEPDRMLAYLRQRAGLTPKARPYGGWDGPGRQLTGHIAGHYLSAVSYMYRATGDQRFRQRADYVVAELRAVQDKRGTGYVGALLGKPATRPATGPVNADDDSALVDGELLFDELAKGHIRSSGFDLNGMWSPWYVEHKLFAGLRDAYRMTGNRAALDVETKFAAWADGVVGRLSDAQAQKMLATEFGGMNEVLVDLYADTGDRRWLALAKKFHHDAVVDPIAAGKDVLGGKHGNTQIPKFIGSLAEYLYTGDADADADAGAAARYFWDFVVGHHSFATGGHGYDEYFGNPDRLSGQVDGTGQRSADLRTAESCNVYNMLKLTRRLFALRPDIRYADFQERALLNHVLASIDPSDGRTCYMVPVGPGVAHEYQDMFESFTCCVGTGMENHALLGDGLYYAAGADRLWITAYVPSTASWAAAGATLSVNVAGPEGGSATVKLALKEPRQLTLSFRRPAWAGEGFALAVNGQSVAGVGEPGSFVDVTRRWADGDTVTLALPPSLRTEPLPDNPARVALMWGPLVLAGDFGPEGSGREGGTGKEGGADVPVLPYAGVPVADWLKAVEGKPAGTFHVTTAQGREMTLVPFYALHERRYGLYWDLYTPAQWADRRAAHEVERARRERLAAATIAFVQVGQMQPERDFNFRGEGSLPVRVDGRPGRGGGRWMSLDVPVDPAGPMQIAVTISNDAAAVIELSVDGTPVGKYERRPEEDSRLTDLSYAVPPAAVAGKKRVTVRLASPPGLELPAIFGLRVLRTSAGLP